MSRPGGLRGALSAEWRKTRRQRFPLVACLLAVAATVGAGLRAGTHDHGFPVNGYYVVCESARWGLLMAGLLVLLHAATTISGEATAGTLKLVLVRPVGRVQFVLAKALMLLALIVVLAGLIALTAWILGASLGGYGDIYDEGLGGEPILRLEAERIGDKPLVALAISSLVLLAYGALGLAISCLTTSSATAVTAATLICLPLFLAPNFLGSGEVYLFTHHATEYLDLAAEWSKGYAERWDSELLMPGLIVPLVYTFVLLGAALTIFRRKDIAL